MGVSHVLLTNWTGIYIFLNFIHLASTPRRHQYYCSMVKRKPKERERILEDPLRTVGRPIFLSTVTTVHSFFADAKYLPVSSF